MSLGLNDRLPMNARSPQDVVAWVKSVDLSSSGTGRMECAFVADAINLYREFMDETNRGRQYNLRTLPERMERVLRG